MCQSNIVVISSRKYSYGSDQYPITSYDELRSFKNDQILNPKDCRNYIIELEALFPESTQYEEVPICLFNLIRFLNDYIFIKSNSNTKKLVLVFEFYKKKINVILRGFLIGFLKSAQVECNFGFSFIFVLKNTEITSNDALFISELFKKDLDWFVNNEIILE